MQCKDRSGRTGVPKTKLKRPPSPYHVSSMTVYPRDGGKGFSSCKKGAEQQLEEPATDDKESDFSSSDLRAKWFLSTNQWQGFIPLQSHGTDSLHNEETSLPVCTDDVNDAIEMSSTVSESLEKMNENHSLFYKIACDISISDSDITKNDGNSNEQTSPRPKEEEEEEELVITESVPEEVTHKSGISFNQENKDPSLILSSQIDDNSQDSTLDAPDTAGINIPASPVKEARVHKEIPQRKHEHAKKQTGQLEIIGATTHEAAPQDTDRDHTQDDDAKTKEEHSEAKESDDRALGQKLTKEMRKCVSLNEENKETVEDRGNDRNVNPSSSTCEGRSVIRSASIGKARVTVLRTSL